MRWYKQTENLGSVTWSRCFKELMEIIKNVFDKCENIVIIDGKKKKKN
jgi:hypothetical protein